MHSRVLPFLFVLFFLSSTFCMAGDLAIIVDTKNEIANVSELELEKLLKASVQKWPNGRNVRVFLTDPRGADPRTILPRVYKMTPEQIKSFVDAHKGDIQVVGSDEIVLAMVASNPGAIGIVNVYSINSHVKVIKVDQKLPLEQGYLLHGN
jgi:ABC-type phosphate transport system substrate-binding protein